MINPDIRKKIFTIRETQVMLDSDLAELYSVPVKALNQAVKRNSARFPEDFMFQLEDDELAILQSQIVTTNIDWSKKRYSPHVFTEQGVATLSGILKSKTAIEVNINIMRAFVTMRRFISANGEVFSRLDRVEMKQIEHEHNFEKVFKALDSEKPKKGIFYDGQVFDAYAFISKLIRSANKSIILIDNYVDETVLTLFSKQKKGVRVRIYTKQLTPELKLDLKKYNAQYTPLDIKEFDDTHDRFMIIDEKEIYHFGASLKDLGKKWFAFSRFKKETVKMLERLE